MEITIKEFVEDSNFKACANVYKNIPELISFNVYESISENKINCKNVFFDDVIEGKIFLCYPLKVSVEVKVKFKNLYSLINQIRKAYRLIYQNPEKYGIWGHSIYNLQINSIKILKYNLIYVGIES